MIGPDRLRTVRSRSRAFTATRLPHFGHAFAVAFSGFIRESITATDGFPASPFSSSAASSISLIVMPSRKRLSAWRRASSSRRSFSENCFSARLRAMT